MKHVWLTNLLSPQVQLLKASLIHSDQDVEPDYNLLLHWLSQKAIGEPKPTEGNSIEHLKAQGYVGVYKLI